MADDVQTAAADPDSQSRRSTGLVNVPDPGAGESVVPVFGVWDAARSLTWYEGLGFRRNWVHRVGPGFPALVSLLRGEYVELRLREHTGEACPPSLACFTVQNLEQVAAEFGVEVTEGAGGPEVRLCDPDGNRLRLTTARTG